MTHDEQLLEAIREGTLTIRHKDGSQWQLDANDKQMICSGLEKQIPNKPVGSYESIRCSNGHFIPVPCRRDNMKFCPMCGQAIDWSEVE